MATSWVYNLHGCEARAYGCRVVVFEPFVLVDRVVAHWVCVGPDDVVTMKEESAPLFVLGVERSEFERLSVYARAKQQASICARRVGVVPRGRAGELGLAAERVGIGRLASG